MTGIANEFSTTIETTSASNIILGEELNKQYAFVLILKICML